MSKDPITIAVIQAGVVAAADEMFEILKKTSMSPIIYEVLDVGTGITDKHGYMVGSGAGIPTFVGILDKAVKRIIEIHGLDNVHAGDLFITNDPYYGGVTHLNDVVVAMPVFHQGECIAWASSIGHWSDVGGSTPGSMSTKVTEIIQEGLRLPAVKLFEQDNPVTSLLEIITCNSRLPEITRGDLWSQISASRRAAKRIVELANNYGLNNYNLALADIFEEGEKRARKGLMKLPKGKYEASELQENNDPWKVSITITEKEFIVDLTDNPRQKEGPYNTSRDGAVISSQMIFKALTDPHLFCNEGSFRPLKVITAPGTVFEATGTAPHGYYFETRIRLYDLLWQCMAKAMPDNLPAGHFGSICGTVIAGVHPDTGRKYTMVEPQLGGWGATSTRNGMNCMYSLSHGETYVCPVEICEARYGLEVGWKKLLDDPGGKGLFEGGKGLSTSYRMKAKAIVSAGYSRSKNPVWGLNGGCPGGTNKFNVKKKGYDTVQYSFVSDLEVNDGDEIVIETAKGGGWGTPIEEC